MRGLGEMLLAIGVGGVFDYVTPPPHQSPLRSAPLTVTQASGTQTFDSEEQENISVYKKALPSVVNITSTAMAFDFFYGRVPQHGQGSGFVLDKEGHILTNYHVVEGARQLEVTTSDKKKYPATGIAADPQNHPPLIKVSRPRPP